jgi:hypothetical protein
MSSTCWGPFRTAIVVGSVGLVAACGASPDSSDTTLPGSAATSTLVEAGPSTTDAPHETQSTGPGLEFSEGAVVEVMDRYAFPADRVHPAGSVEWVEWLAFCNAAFGFNFDVIREPGQEPSLYGQVPLAQQDLQLRVSRACQESAVERGHFFRIARTDDLGRRVHAGFLDVHACMVSNGFPVTEPPSEETFLADWTDGGEHWHPYEATPFGGSLSVSPDAEGDIPAQVSAQMEIQATCPADWGSILDSS